jgi:hypothetical protein
MTNTPPAVRHLAKMALLLICLAGSLLFLAQTPAYAAPAPTGFTYQGELLKGGTPANATCNFAFSLYDAESGGTK